MGRRHSEVAEEEKLVPYHIVGGPNDLVKVHVEKENKDYTPPEISAMILQKLKQTAEDYLGEKVVDAVITVPAYFNDSQRQATKDAGEIAGLKVHRILNEPTASALAYGLDKRKDEKIAVFDLGGGTFDISILETGEGVFEVKAVNGDTHLGGDNYDQVLIDYVADEFKKQNGIDLRKDQMALQRLKEACEKAKCEVSLQTQTDISLPFITADQTGPKHLQMTLTRAKFEQLTQHLTERCRKPCEQALRDSGMKPSDIDEVILVGGSSRTPAVQQIARDIFGKEPNKSVNPDEAIAVGAAIQAGILRRRPDRHRAPRRYAALARHRDPRRRDDPAHRAQHHDPDQQEGDLHHRGRQPDRRRNPRPPGRARNGHRQPHPRPVPARRAAARAARHAAGRGDVRH